MKPYLENTQQKNKADKVAQAVEHLPCKFKPQSHKEKTKREILGGAGCQWLSPVILAT
jgi:hypothetical protein